MHEYAQELEAAANADSGPACSLATLGAGCQNEIAASEKSKAKQSRGKTKSLEGRPSTKS